MNIIKKELYELGTVELEYFYILFNSFLGETPLSTHQKTVSDVLFLDMAMTQYFTKTLRFKYF